MNMCQISTTCLAAKKCYGKKIGVYIDCENTNTSIKLQCSTNIRIKYIIYALLDCYYLCHCLIYGKILLYKVLFIGTVMCVGHINS